MRIDPSRLLAAHMSRRCQGSSTGRASWRCVILPVVGEVEGVVQSAGTFGGRWRASLLVAAVPLQSHYRLILRAGAAKILDALIDAYPTALTREELGAAADIVTTGGTFSTYLSDLVRNGLAERQAGAMVATGILMHGSQV